MSTDKPTRAWAVSARLGVAAAVLGAVGWSVFVDLGHSILVPPPLVVAPIMRWAITGGIGTKGRDKSGRNAYGHGTPAQWAWATVAFS